MQQNREPRHRLKHSQLIFAKGAKAIQCRKSLFLTNGPGTTRHPHAKRRGGREGGGGGEGRGGGASKQGTSMAFKAVLPN